MPDIISTRTMLIEKVPPSPEFLRFEREPRTSFYLAGGIIRELRKALEKKQVRVPAPKMT